MPRRVAIVGGGISGLGAAWALHHHPDRFDFRLFEANEQIGGNAITADMPQDSGDSIPFDISVTACIPSVYQHILLLMRKFGIELIDTRFSYSVKYHGRVYAHDFDSDIRRELQAEIAKFQRILRCLHWFGRLTRSRSRRRRRRGGFRRGDLRVQCEPDLEHPRQTHVLGTLHSLVDTLRKRTPVW